MKRIMFVILAAALLSACTTKQSQQSDQSQQPKQPKMLVLYYSQEGTTQKVAEEIAAQTGADIERIDATEPYSGNFDETIQRCRKEREAGVSPTVNPIQADLSQYDVVFLGYPIWFGTYAPPMEVLLKEIDLDGKTVVPFCTFGSGGLQSSVADLRKAQPKADIREGFGIRTARIGNLKPELERFLILSGYKEGEVEQYPDYSAQAPVTDEYAAIFDAACSGYQFPLGKPVTVGIRETSTSTDYCFTAEGTDRDGNVSQSTIYVTVSKTAGAKPEFTMVVR